MEYEEIFAENEKNGELNIINKKIMAWNNNA